MRSSKMWVVLLGLAGLQGCAMALAHFVLQYEWHQWQALQDLPNRLVWTLFALNFSWGVLLLGASGLVLYAAILGPTAGIFTRRTVFIVGLFWAIHGMYVWMNPMPLPSRPLFLWLKILLAGFPATMVALHWIPLMVRSEGRNRTFPRFHVSTFLLALLSCLYSLNLFADELLGNL